jgi:D-alanyl-D-alanine carboxypeptidase (penicillin-binding protein 5/6)
MIMKKLQEYGKIAGNYSGNAALCAILIMIMLLAIGTTALVVTGRKAIATNDSMPEQSIAESVAEESSEADESSEAEPEPEATEISYPEKDFEYQDMKLDDVTAGYSVLLDCDTNTIYSGKNYSKKAYPASLTKLMTIIVTLENCDDLSDTYTFTESDLKGLEDEHASVAGFVAGETVTVEDLLYGAMLPSGADATIGLANYVAGSETAFVELMNEKVEQLGLTGTHFVNASGLHNKNHYTTAQDMALIVESAIKDEKIGEEFLKILGAETYTTTADDENPEGIELTSLFFSRYEGYYIDRDGDGEQDAEIVGGKTGFTDESQYSLASIYKIDNSYYVCITMKSDSDSSATTDNIAIVENYLPTYDLLGEDDDESSEEDESSSTASVIDTTPEPIDETESEESTDESAEATESTEAAE